MRVEKNGDKREIFLRLVTSIIWRQTFMIEMKVFIVDFDAGSLESYEMFFQ